MASARISHSQDGQHAAHGAHGTHGARAARGGGKVAHGDAAGAQTPQDAFAALLASLGGDEDAGLLAPDTTLPQAGDSGAQPGGDASLAATLAMAGVLPAPAVHQAATATVGGGALAGGAAWSPLVPPGAQTPDSLVAQTTLIDKAADSALEPADSITPTVAGTQPKGPARPLGWNALAQSDSATGAASTLGKAAMPEKLSTAELAKAVAQVSSVGLAAGAERRDGAAAGLELHRQAGQTGGEAAALAAPGLQALSGMFGEARAEARQAARGGESAGSAAHVHGTTATGESTADPTRAVPDGSGVTADPSQMAGDDALAEQVAFWVNQKTQNAELTLDRDGQPVEVRVSLSGNEAHVTFRSDQVQTRDALDASTAQLRDLLQSEGLVLAGVTVGGGSGDGEGGAGREPSGRQGTQQGRVQAAGQGGSAVADRAPAGNRALDVFV